MGSHGNRLIHAHRDRQTHRQAARVAKGGVRSVYVCVKHPPPHTHTLTLSLPPLGQALIQGRQRGALQSHPCTSKPLLAVVLHPNTPGLLPQPANRDGAGSNGERGLTAITCGFEAWSYIPFLKSSFSSPSTWRAGHTSASLLSSVGISRPRQGPLQKSLLASWIVS